MILAQAPSLMMRSDLRRMRSDLTPLVQNNYLFRAMLKKTHDYLEHVVKTRDDMDKFQEFLALAEPKLQMHLAIGEILMLLAEHITVDRVKLK